MLLGCLEPMLHITSDLGAEKVMTKYEREREREKVHLIQMRLKADEERPNC